KRQGFVRRDLMRIEHKKINLFVFATGGRDVFALLPDKKPVQLEIFAHYRFTDGSHTSPVTKNSKASSAGCGVRPGPRWPLRMVLRWRSGSGARPALFRRGPAALPARRRPGRFCSRART